MGTQSTWGSQFIPHNSKRIIMRSLVAFALFCVASPCLGAPQFGYQNRYDNRYGYGPGFENSAPMSLNRFRYAQNPFRTQTSSFNRNNNFGLRSGSNNFGGLRSGSNNFGIRSGSNNFGNLNRQASTGNAGIPSIPSVIPSDQGPQIDTDFGVFPLDSQNAMSRQERAQYLSVMQALLNVMETNRPSPQDINTLMVLTRDLARQSNGASSDLFGQFGGFGLDGLESMGLPESGDIIVPVNGIPHIKTQWGAFPLSDVSLMTDAERAKFIPVVRTFISVLQKDNVDPNEINALMEHARELTNLIPESGLGGNIGSFIGENLGSIINA